MCPYRLVDKENVIHDHSEILFSCKEKGNTDICRKMDHLENDYINENKPESEKKYHVLL